MPSADKQSQAIAAVAVLADDLRRSMFEYIRKQRRPVTREEAAEQVGISRKLAAFHLDKLVQAGLLEAGVRPGVRRVGRAPKAYSAKAVDVAVEIPARQHELLAALLLEAIQKTPAGEAPAGVLLRLAEQRGTEFGAEHRPSSGGRRIGAERALTTSERLLAETGYEPDRVTPACLRLRSCPFHPVTAQSPELVCGLNHAFLSGVVDGLGAAAVLDVLLAPQPDECCVEVRAR